MGLTKSIQSNFVFKYSVVCIIQMFKTCFSTPIFYCINTVIIKVFFIK
jgi:hypothetical protein